MTRKLNELHINAVIEAINNNSIEKVFINAAKKPKGAFNLTYSVCEPGVVPAPLTGSKSSIKVQLMRAMQEIKSAVVNNKIHSVSLEFERTTGKFSYQLIQRQG